MSATLKSIRYDGDWLPNTIACGSHVIKIVQKFATASQLGWHADEISESLTDCWIRGWWKILYGCGLGLGYLFPPTIVTDHHDIKWWKPRIYLYSRLPRQFQPYAVLREGEGLPGYCSTVSVLDRVKLAATNLTREIAVGNDSAGADEIRTNPMIGIMRKYLKSDRMNLHDYNLRRFPKTAQGKRRDKKVQSSYSYAHESSYISRPSIEMTALPITQIVWCGSM